MIDYQIVLGDKGRVIPVNVSAGEPFTIKLPTPTADFIVTIKDAKGGSKNAPITIQRAGSELIDDLAEDLVIQTDFEAITLISDGTNWKKFSNFKSANPDPNFAAVGSLGLIYGGGPLMSIDSLNLSIDSNSENFANMYVPRQNVAAVGSRTRAVGAGGSYVFETSVIDYVEFSTKAKSEQFGNMASNTLRYGMGAGSNQVRGIFGAGYISGSGRSSNCDYITIATTGNSTNFGALTAAFAGGGGAASQIRCFIAGGDNGVQMTRIEYVTIMTTSSAAFFGNMSVNRELVSCVSNGIYGLLGGGFNPTTAVIDRITVATTGNATNFAALSTARYGVAAMSDTAKAVWAGGGPSSTTIIEKSSYTSGATATNFGTLINANSQSRYGCSNAHGGL